MELSVHGKFVLDQNLLLIKKKGENCNSSVMAMYMYIEELEIDPLASTSQVLMAQDCTRIPASFPYFLFLVLTTIQHTFVCPINWSTEKSGHNESYLPLPRDKVYISTS